MSADIAEKAERFTVLVGCCEFAEGPLFVVNLGHLFPQDRN